MTDGRLEGCNRFISVGHSPLRDVERLKYWGHALTAEVDYFRLRARVQLFAGPGHTHGRVYDVALGRNPSLIDFNSSLGNFFVYYPKEDRGEFDGELTPCPESSKLRTLDYTYTDSSANHKH